MNSSTAVSAELEIKLVVPQERAIVPLMASLSYSKDDAYAVRLDLNVGLDEPVTWVFGRDLLSAGTEGEAGEGDVRVWPSPDSEGFGEIVLNLSLSSPHGAAKFEAPLREVSAFLRRTYDLVRSGQESAHVDVDAELTEILRQAS